MEASKCTKKKIKTGLSLTPTCVKSIDDSLSLCGASSRNELVERAVKFYISYKATEKNTTFLEAILERSAAAAMQKTEDRLAKILFKLAVEHAKIIMRLSQFLDLEDIDLRELQREAYEEICEIQGLLTLEKIRRDQRNGE